MLRSTTPSHGLPYIKLGALAMRQLTKPLITRIVKESGEHPIVYRLCVSVGRLYLGTTGSLQTLVNSLTEKEENMRREAERAEEIKRAKEEWRKSMIQEAITAAREVVAAENKMRHRTMEVRDAEMVAEAAACAAAFAVADVTLDARNHATDAAVAVLERSKEKYTSEEPLSISTGCVPSSHQQPLSKTQSVRNNNSSASSSALPNAGRSVTSTKSKSASDRNKAAVFLSNYSRFTSQDTFGMRSSGQFNFYNIPKERVRERYYPTNAKSHPQLEEKIRDEGAEVLCNFLVFFTLAIIVIYEYLLSKESERLKEIQRFERLRRLEQKVNILIEIENSERRNAAIKEQDILNAEIDKAAEEGIDHKKIAKDVVGNIQMLASIPTATVVEVQSIFGWTLSNTLYLLGMMCDGAVKLAVYSYKSVTGTEIKEAVVSPGNPTHSNLESATETFPENMISWCKDVFKGIWSV